MTTYARRLGLFSGTMAVIGGIIGGGIFRTPAAVAQRVGSPFLFLLAWVLGGLIALIGAFCFGELGQRQPKAGGGYVYLRETFGPLAGFLYGWTLLLVMTTGAMAAVAITFADYFLSLTGLDPSLRVPLAVGAIVLLAGINYVGVKPAAITQNIFTILKLVALTVMIVAGLAIVALIPSLPLARPGPSLPVGEGLGGVVATLGVALVPIVFTYGGWQQTNFIAEEIIDPERNLPRALVLGVVGVVAVYLLANITYLRVLGLDGLAASTAPAADVMRQALGNAGARFIAAGIAASTFGFLNLVILVTPRVLQAMAADGVFFPRLARLHPVYRTPTAAILVMAVWSILLTLSGTFGQLVDYVSFGDWLFFGLTVAGLFVFRARDTSPAVGKFRVPGYPVTPALFVLAAGYVVVSAVISNPKNAVIGSALILLGIPVFLYWKARGERPARRLGV
ncbi:MAG TPA: amino acid permease [Gemmatimonadales bacterium]|nr:amino acid permease [Gemmatimonadales bacterium]